MPPFEEAFPALKRLAFRVAYRILGDHGEAEDVAQESTARAFSRWRSVAGYAEPWVARVAGNLSLDALRRRKRRPPETTTTEREPDVASRLDLQAALKELPRRQREVVILRYMADRTIDDVARVLRCHPGTVKRAAHDGLATLRRRLDVDLEEDA